MNYIEWIKNALSWETTKKELDKTTSDISKLQKQIPKVNPKEKYYNNKYPSVNLVHTRTDFGRDFKIDLRLFVQPIDCKLPTIKGKTNDVVALNSLLWVIDNIKYVSDNSQYGMSEYWSFPYQVIDTGKDDCESGAGLLASIMIKNGIPSWKVRVSAGFVDDKKGNKGGHAWVTYYCEEKNKWVILDWCYWVNKEPIKNRKVYKDEIFYKSIWYSFNNLYSWTKDGKSIPKYSNVLIE